MMELISALSERLGPWFLVAVLLIVVALDRTGFVQKLIGRRHDSREEEQKQRQAFIDDIVEDAERQRKWRVEDVRRLTQSIIELRNDIKEKDETIRSLARGQARERHALRDLMVYVQALREKLKKNNIPVVAFNGWARLTELDPDLMQQFKDSLGEE